MNYSPLKRPTCGAKPLLVAPVSFLFPSCETPPAGRSGSRCRGHQAGEEEARGRSDMEMPCALCRAGIATKGRAGGNWPPRGLVVAEAFGFLEGGEDVLEGQSEGIGSGKVELIVFIDLEDRANVGGRELKQSMKMQAGSSSCRAAVSARFEARWVGEAGLSPPS